MPDQTGKPDQVSLEAHERVQHDNTKLSSENAQLKEKVSMLEATVLDFKKVESASRHFMPEDARKAFDEAQTKVELVMPHLRDVEADKVGELLSSDRFSVLSQTPAPPAQDDGTPTGTPEQPEGGFGGPNPGADSGKPVTGEPTGKISRGSPEYRAAVQRNDHALIEKWYSEDRVVEPQRPY